MLSVIRFAYWECLGGVARGGVLLTVRSGLSTKQKQTLCFENCIYYYHHLLLPNVKVTN